MNWQQHSMNVCSLSLEIGRELKLKDGCIHNLIIAARFHDIGKERIPNHILYKKDKLSVDEWNIIKSHCILGYEMLKKRGYNDDIINGVLYHHEKYDGTGYMAGLSGNNINLISRIITVADSYDAMVSNRIYSEALSEEEALNEIEKNLGIQFDPTIGEIFVMNKIKRGAYNWI